MTFQARGGLADLDRLFVDRKAADREYRRLYRAGIRRPVKIKPLEQRLLAKIDRENGDEPDIPGWDLGPCWPWTGATNEDGYGIVRGARDVVAGKQGPLILAHRAALSLALGRPIRRGMFGNHKCHNPPCCRPRHLYEGTAEENVRDMIEAGRYKGIAPVYRERVG